MQARFTPGFGRDRRARVVCLCLFGVGPGTCTSQPDGDSRDRADGPLRHDGSTGASRGAFPLVDEEGDVEAYLIPRESLDLDSYVGKSVELSVREPLLRQDGEPRVWVDRIALAAGREQLDVPQRISVQSTVPVARLRSPSSLSRSRMRSWRFRVSRYRVSPCRRAPCRSTNRSTPCGPTRLDLGRYRLFVVAHGWDVRSGAGDDQSGGDAADTGRCVGRAWHGRFCSVAKTILIGNTNGVPVACRTVFRPPECGGYRG